MLSPHAPASHPTHPSPGEEQRSLWPAPAQDDTHPFQVYATFLSVAPAAGFHKETFLLIIDFLALHWHMKILSGSLSNHKSLQYFLNLWFFYLSGSQVFWLQDSLIHLKMLKSFCVSKL